MAEPDPILVGLSGATFILSAESGGIIQSFSRNTDRKKIEVVDGSVGYTTGLVYWDPKATYNVRIILTSALGVAAASPGVALTLANTTTGNGVAAGGIYTDSTALSHSAGQLREFTATATQMPGVA